MCLLQWTDLGCFVKGEYPRQVGVLTISQKKIRKNINEMPTSLELGVYKTSVNLLQDATFPVTVWDAICEQYRFGKSHLHLKTG